MIKTSERVSEWGDRSETERERRTTTWDDYKNDHDDYNLRRRDVLSSEAHRQMDHAGLSDDYDDDVDDSASDSDAAVAAAVGDDDDVMESHGHVWNGTVP